MLIQMIWFRRYGWFHVPVTIAGSIILFIAVLFCFNVFLAEDKLSHSASDTLYAIYPYFITTFLLYEWIAERTSKKRHFHSPEESGSPQSGNKEKLS